MVIFIFWIFFIPLEQKMNLNHIKPYVKIKDFCNIIMPSEDTKILGFNQYQKSNKAAFIIYTDLEWLIEKIDEWESNPKN